MKLPGNVSKMESFSTPPAGRGRGGPAACDPASYPRQTRDYVTYTPDTSLWLAMMKCVDKGITLRPAA